MLVTVHSALNDVAAQLTVERELRIIRLAHRTLQDMGIPQPRIAVAELNPRAGKGGLFGREEVDAIAPAIALARAQGMGLAPGRMVQTEVERGGLVRVLPRWGGPAQDVRLVYPSRRYQPVRTRLTIDFVVREMACVPGLQPLAAQAAGS